MKLILKTFYNLLRTEKRNKGWQKKCSIFLRNYELFSTKLQILEPPLKCSFLWRWSLLFNNDKDS